MLQFLLRLGFFDGAETQEGLQRSSAERYGARIIQRVQFLSQLTVRNAHDRPGYSDDTHDLL